MATQKVRWKGRFDNHWTYDKRLPDEVKVPEEVQDALARYGWNVFGVHAEVEDAIKKLRKKLRKKDGK